MGGMDIQTNVAANTMRSRLLYLTLNLFFILVCMLFAMAVYGRTHALTIELDSITLVCDALAVSINILVEIMKSRVSEVRKILVFDLVGCLLSLALLIGVAGFGFYDALDRKATTERGFLPPRVTNLRLMITYSSFSLATTMITLVAFQYWRKDMLPASSGLHDRLNLYSNLAHAVVDFITSSVVVLTTVFLIWTEVEDREEHEPGYVVARDRARVDVVGSFGVCICIVICVGLLVKEAHASVRHISELEHPPLAAGATDAEGCGGRATGSEGPAVEGQAAKRDYGAMKEKQTA